MGLFKRIARKVRNTGSRAIHLASVGARKISNSTKRAAPILAKAGAFISGVGTAVGVPQVAAIGAGLSELGAGAKVVSKIAGSTHSGIEKARRPESRGEGLGELMSVGRDTYDKYAGR